jgi:hypothetical protein
VNLRQLALVGLAALALGGTAAAASGQPGQVAQASSTPPSLSSPSPSPAPGRRGRRAPEPAPSASESPEPPQFSTMDGVWEVQLQPLTGARTVYSHLYVTQKSDALTGTWKRAGNEQLPFTGTFDGRLFKLTAKDAKGVTWTLSGYAENFSDMVGLLIGADPKDKGTPFTASHRKRERLTVGA